MNSAGRLSTEGETARYQVGIDLGTTNCALAFIDGAVSEPRVRDFQIPQIVAPGETQERDVLPSFCYEPATDEFPAGSLTAPAVPGGEYVVGWFARRHGAQTPGRLISSAKSWLCHGGVDRTAPLLPWHGAADVARISPVEASARYLAHLRAAWDAAFAAHPLSAQHVVITAPASFDEVARELTLRAAEKAGLERVTLLEEPQAAFYSWMAERGATADQEIQPGDLTLICDVGGGTSDFTLIEARSIEGGRVRFHRVAVGQHLILGGDNMDLALAHHIEGRLAGGGRLDPRRWGVLVQASRHAKETLLGSDAPERASVSIAGGARLVGGSLQTEITRDEARELLVDGFFPKVPFGEKAARARSGFQEFGLPYAADAAVTRHLSEFLAAHAAAVRERGEGGAIFPNQVLFNGGVFESPVLRERMIETLEAWRREIGAAESGPLRVLPNPRLDLAVARGAAYAGWLRREPGRRIAAGLARAYYIQVARSGAEGPTAVCLAPAGLEEGDEVTLPQRLTLRIREPVEFALFTSSTRTHDKPGDILSVDPEQLTALPPVRTVVGSSRVRKGELPTAEVELRARLTEIGTLDVRFVETGRNRAWKLEFDVRGTSRRTRRAARGIAVGGAESMEEAVVEACAEAIRNVFGPATPAGGRGDPAGLARRLEEATELRRDRWPLPLLRSLWSRLMEVEAGRRFGVMHEARWLNLLGFALRPGFGHTIDDWRVQQTWKLSGAGVAFPKNEMCRAEWCILWRRVAGGLGVGHQRALADAYSGIFRAKGGKRATHYGPHETSEIWRLLASLELLPTTVKVEMGATLLERLEKPMEGPVLGALWWALGRIGARVPAYGPLNGLAPVETAEEWLRRAIQKPSPHQEAVFAVVQMARRTGDRHRDISEEARGDVLGWLRENRAEETQIALVAEGGGLDEEQEERVFGETLPPGLHLDASESGFNQA